MKKKKHNEAHLLEREKLKAAILHVRDLGSLFLLNTASVSVPTKLECVHVMLLEIHFANCKLKIDFGHHC